MFSNSTRRLLKASLMAAAVLLPGAAARADSVVQIHKDENRGVWEGWGCSLAWWGHAVGGKNYQDLYADLFFTDKSVPFLDQKLPGLSMNIVRYNIGGGGRNEHKDSTGEKVPNNLVWYKDIDGYWADCKNLDPESASWDWDRDLAQRRMLKAIDLRGFFTFEFFSNAPMWWMNTSRSSAGGRLEPARNRDFARYLATVTQYLQEHMALKVHYLEPFNEPSEGWWTYPKNQEGCTIPRKQQVEILANLREELDSRGLQEIALTAADENTMDRARENNNYYRTREILVNGQFRNVPSLVNKINVHGYNGLAPWRDNAARAALRRSAGKSRIWMSEYGDGEASGMALAQSIVEDMSYLRPIAWIYWQPLEQAGSRWGLVNAYFAPGPDDLESGRPNHINGKYYVMAQFSRFLRPGMTVLGSNDNNSVIGYDAVKRQLALVTVNYKQPQTISYDLSNLTRVGGTANLTVTETKGDRRFETSTIVVSDKRLTFEAAVEAVYSVVIEGVDL